MITSSEEYYQALFKIYDKVNIPNLAILLPQSEHIYSIDLNSRTIESPEFLSVLDDHVSETIYFIVDRFYDNVDLSTTTCVIQYVNPKGEERFYNVPFYDIETYGRIERENGIIEHKMLIPWCIEGEATRYAGEITYAFRFFRVSEKVENNNRYLNFVLNTLPAKSRIKEGLKIVDTYIAIEDLTAEQFTEGKKQNLFYYTKNESGEYIEAKQYDSNAKYYLLIDSYNPIASKYEQLLNDIARLKRETQCYWYDASDRSKMK